MIKYNITLGTPWKTTQEWVDGRNLPERIGTERFHGIGRRQDVAREETLRRMIKTTR